MREKDIVTLKTAFLCYMRVISSLLYHTDDFLSVIHKKYLYFQMNVWTGALLNPWLCLSIVTWSFRPDISSWTCNGSSCSTCFHHYAPHVIIYTELKWLVIPPQHMCPFQAPFSQYKRLQKSRVIAESLSFA